MKVCYKCKIEQDNSCFQKSKQHKDGLFYICKNCWSFIKKKDYKEKWFVYQARLKKSEAKKKGVPYDLTPDYLKRIWTDNCPVLKKKFDRHNKKSDFCPTLDRKNPDKGYVKNNVCFISARANRIKYDASIEELHQIINYMERP